MGPSGALTDQRQQHVVPAGAGHLPLPAHNIRQQKLQRQALHDNVRKSKLLQPCGERIKLGELLDYPAFAQQPAVTAFESVTPPPSRTDSQAPATSTGR